VLWFTFSYLPIAHMVWYWDGPDAITDAVAREGHGQSRPAGCWAKGALDFAGGTVVHINAGVAGLVGAYVIGKRVGYGKESMAPHSLTLTMVGASMLWVGWFGFNAGSNLEANGGAALAFINTLVATAAAVLSWAAGEAMSKGKASMLGAASGAVAGLVAITPACGFVGPMGAIVIGLVAGFGLPVGRHRPQAHARRGRLAGRVRRARRGRHLGALLTGVFHRPRWAAPGILRLCRQQASQAARSAARLDPAQGVITTVIWSAVVAFIAFKIVDMVIGLRVTEEEEREGLDIRSPRRNRLQPLTVDS
jgi:Amt family ammonium transporter